MARRAATKAADKPRLAESEEPAVDTDKAAALPATAEQVSGTLYNLYRPKSFGAVIGQAAVVKSLQGVLKADSAHTFILAGPSGVGKTTLARISARYLRCEPADIYEIAAAVRTGVDDMREVLQQANYRPLGGGEAKAIILDEVQRLSKQAWESLLKMTEEPPAHLYWFLCTTEPDKIPKTIQTRAATFRLKSVADADLRDLLEDVCNKEDIELAADVDGLLIRYAEGSPRQLLSGLTLVRSAESKRDAAVLLQSAVESEPVRDLCRFLIDGKGSWQKAMGLIAKLASENEPEAVRILVSRYVAAVLIEASSDRQASYLLSVLDAFQKPYSTAEGQAPLLLSVGTVLLANR